MKVSAAALLFGTVAIACGGPGIAGGHTVRPGAEPEGTVRVRYDRLECHDAKNAPLRPGPQRIDVVDLRDGRQVLVEYRSGFDTMVVENRFSDESGTVFQVSLKSNDGRPYLRQYRVPLAGPGELSITDDWEHHETKSGFVGKFRRTLLTCRLTAAAR